MAVLQRWCRVGKPAKAAVGEDAEQVLRRRVQAHADELRDFAKTLRTKMSDHVRQAETWEMRAMAALQAGKDDFARQALERRNEARGLAVGYARELRKLRESRLGEPVSLAAIDNEIRACLRECRAMARDLRGLMREFEALVGDLE